MYKKFKMAANMAAEILIRMYLSSPFRYEDKWSIHSYNVKNVEFRYVEIITTVTLLHIFKDGSQDDRRKFESNVSHHYSRLKSVSFLYLKLQKEKEYSGKASLGHEAEIKNSYEEIKGAGN